MLTNVKEIFLLQTLYITCFGEQTGVPILKDTLKTLNPPESLKIALKTQLKEEVFHAREYKKYTNNPAYIDSKFEPEILKFILGINVLTVRIFALQIILEGLAVNVLKFRLANWPNYPAREFDLLVLEDETRHNNSIFPFIPQLKIIDEEIERQVFIDTKESLYKIFKSAFSPFEIKSFHQEYTNSDSFDFRDFLLCSNYRDLAESNNRYIEDKMDEFFDMYYS